MKFGAFSAILSKTEYEYINFKNNNSDKVLLKVTQSQTLYHNGEKTFQDFLDNNNDYVYKIYKNSITNINYKNYSISWPLNVIPKNYTV